MARGRSGRTGANTAPFPDKQDILDWLTEDGDGGGSRDIARAFGLRGADRARLRDLMREMEDDGLIAPRSRRRRSPATLPRVTVVEVTGTDDDGDAIAGPVDWRHDTPPPVIRLRPDRKRTAAPGRGDRMLVRLSPQRDGGYLADVITRVPSGPQRVLGIFRELPSGGRIESVERKRSDEFAVAAGDTGDAAPGELVAAEFVSGRRMGLRQVRVVERFGAVDGPRAFSMIAVARHGIPQAFPPEAIAEADAAKPVALGKRTDLRPLPLVTIDGADARDYDDAVFAEPDPDTPGGWRLIVAIADVAHYVREASALDKEAYRRGNSVYFPDRVVPMLPEALSNDLCSLRPDEDRACVAAEMWIDRDGAIRRHRFARGLMRSVARLTYERVQAGRDGTPDDALMPLMADVVAPLYGAYDALARARRDRGAIEIELPERRVILDGDQPPVIEPRVRLDSHRLIEEFMIAANVAAAETLESRSAPCMYRVHEPPDPAKIEAFRPVLESIGLKLAKGQVLRPQHFNDILARVDGSENAELVNELVLRCQSQADYRPGNAGHFGLGLTRYAHFTSPIRRYADLLVHRSLIAALGLGAGGAADHSGGSLGDTGRHISETERRAVMAERETLDRYAAATLTARIDQVFAGRVVGVTRAGLFIRVLENGAEGLAPMRLLPGGPYRHDERRQALVERRGKGASCSANPSTCGSSRPIHCPVRSSSRSRARAARNPVRRPRQSPGNAQKSGDKRRFQGNLAAAAVGITRDYLWSTPYPPDSAAGITCVPTRAATGRKGRGRAGRNARGDDSARRHRRPRVVAGGLCGHAQALCQHGL